MDHVSVSKGVFALPGSYKIGQKKNRPPKPAMFDEPWYVAYKEIWSSIEKAAEQIHLNTFTQILDDLKSYILSVDYRSLCEEIPTVILLTGVNLPDHDALFETLSQKLEDVSQNVAIIHRRDSHSLKNMIEETVFQLVENSQEDMLTIKKNQCTPKFLCAWYQKLKHKKPLVVIIPDFESFSANMLQDFILIFSIYAKTIDFVFIFGVATTLHAVHRSLPHHVTCKLQVQVFHTQTQVKILSNVIEGTVLAKDNPFKLTSRAFQLLTDIFLFYDFSVHGFLQGYKLCMMQHFYGNNIFALCCDKNNINERLSALNNDDLNEIKKLPSVAKYLQGLPKEKRDSLQDMEFKELLRSMINQVHTVTTTFHTIVECLHYLTSDLPNAPLGKQLREVYAKSVSCIVTDSEEYKECLQLLGFLSKEELLSKLDSMRNIIQNSHQDVLSDAETKLANHIDLLRNASLDVTQGPTETIDVNEKLNRLQLKEKLLKMSQAHSLSPYKRAQAELMSFLDREIFHVHLRNPSRLPLNEVFFYGDGNTTKQHIVGSPRAAIHTALNNPQVYLECSCCTLDNEQVIVSTLPDISIIYKLHLECRRFINLYDWLQAFLMIVTPDSSDEEQTEVDPEVQARFTRAVAELQFLGFIKSSRRKTDHVMRLTWESS